MALIIPNAVYGKDTKKSIRASLLRRFWQAIFFFGTNLKEQPLCWLKPTKQSSTLEFTRIMEEITSSSGKLDEAARKWHGRLPRPKWNKQIGLVNTCRLVSQICLFCYLGVYNLYFTKLKSRVINIPHNYVIPQTMPHAIPQNSFRLQPSPRLLRPEAFKVTNAIIFTQHMYNQNNDFLLRVTKLAEFQELYRIFDKKRPRNRLDFKS